MVTIRNPNEARARTVFAGEALENGMFVKVVPGDAAGDPPKVVRITTKAELQDAGLVKGVVTFIPDNDLAVDFIINPVNYALTLNVGADSAHKIPAGSACVVWMDRPIFGFHPSAVAPALVTGFAAVREGDRMAVDITTGKLTILNSGDVTRDVYVGTVYQHEGAEITVMLQAIG
jgi:hypothetical protein